MLGHFHPNFNRHNDLLINIKNVASKNTLAYYSNLKLHENRFCNIGLCRCQTMAKKSFFLSKEKRKKFFFTNLQNRSARGHLLQASFNEQSYMLNMFAPR
jgi:hypothetical protein